MTILTPKYKYITHLFLIILAKNGLVASFGKDGSGFIIVLVFLLLHSLLAMFSLF